MRVGLVGIKQETASFNPVMSGYGSFAVCRGEDIVRGFASSDTEIAGLLAELGTAEGPEVVPGWFAEAVPGGCIDQAALDRLTAELVESVAAMGPVAGMVVVLHGAMAGSADPDPEGTILRGIRKLVGDAPVVCTIDLHAVITDRMLEAADCLVPFHTYPHTDQRSTGRRAARVLLSLLGGASRPAITRVRIPLLVRGDELLTDSGLFGRAVAECREMESEGTAVAAGVVIGNPFTDVPDLATNVLIAAEGGRRKEAAGRAVELARFMWDHRRRFVADLVGVEEALDVVAATQGLTVLSDAADATSSGASGDSTCLLGALLRREWTRRSLVPVVDAAAAGAACAAGEGAQIDLEVGGSLDARRHRKVALRARVQGVYGGRFTYENGRAEDAGPTAVVRAGACTLLITSRPVYVVGQAVYRAHGLDPASFDAVVVKSPNGFRTYYERIADRIVAVDCPGSTSAVLTSLPYAACRRPVFPLDPDTTFEPEIQYIDPGR